LNSKEKTRLKFAQVEKRRREESGKISEEIRKVLVGKTIRNVLVRSTLGGDTFIKLVTDEGTITIGANDTGAWLERFRREQNNHQRTNSCVR